MCCALLSGAISLCLWGLRSRVAEAAWPGEISGSVPATGWGSIDWSGGGLDLLLSVLASRGCAAGAIWASSPDGASVAYIVGAPAFVNATFMSRYPSGALPEGSLVVDCAEGGTPPIVPVIVVSRSVAFSFEWNQGVARGLTTLCIKYSVGGGSAESCQALLAPPFEADNEASQSYFRAAACHKAAVVARPLPACWPL